MADKIFPTQIPDGTPDSADRILFADTSDAKATKDCAIAELPISDATLTAIGVVQSDINAHEARVDNPHSVTKSQVGLGNVDNTSDLDKPVSTATQNALNLKANDNSVVHTTGDEPIYGLKTFSSSPIVPTPTTNFQASTKKYVDDTVVAIGAGDMARATYDTNFDGKVDTSNDVSNSPTTTLTSVASQGGLLINIDGAVGDIARTTDGWVEDEKFGIRYATGAATSTIKFSSIAPKTGRLTIQFDCSVNASSFPQFRNSGVASPGATWAVNDMTKYGIPIKPSTKYRIYLPIETVNTGGLGAYLSYVGYSTAGTRFTDVLQSIAGTFNGIKIYEFTSNANDAYLLWAIGYRSGTTGTMNVDYNNFRIEEVVEPVANSLTSSSPSLVSFTAVGSTGNIDQSLDPTFVAVNTYTPPIAISEVATDKQTFIPTKSKCTRIGIYPVAKGTGNWTVTVHDASNVVQAAITIANASLTNGVVNYFNVPCNLTALGTYHFHVTSTVADGTVKVGTAGDLETCSFIQNYYKPTTNFKASQNNKSVSISADEDGFLDGSKIDIVNGVATFTETFGTFYLLNYTISGSDLIAKIKLPGVAISGKFTSDKTLTYSSDGVSYSGTFPVGEDLIYVKIAAYSGITSFAYSINFDTSSINTLYNYPTNKNIVDTYTKSLSSATTTAIYRATKFGFPAIEYSNGEYQFLEVDTTATGSTVHFSPDGTTYTLVADGGSIALTSTVNPVVYVRSNITANRIYLSSNDYNASRNKDGSNKQTVVYQVKNQGLIYDVQELQKEDEELREKLTEVSTLNTGDETATTIKNKLGITTLSGSNTGDQTSIVGITGTIAQFNTACTDADFATGGGTATGTNTGDQTSIVGITGTKAQFDTACTDGNFMYTGDTATTTNALQSATTTVNVSSATAPSSGQVLTATSSTEATWQTPVGVQTLSTSATNIAMNIANTTETTIITQSITGGSMGTSKAIRLRLFGDWLCSTGSPTVTIRVKYGTTTLVSLPIVSQNSSTNFGFEIDAIIKENGTTTSQLGAGNFTAGQNSSTIGNGNQISKYQTSSTSGTENSANTLNLTVTTQLNSTSGAPTVNFRYYTIELL